MAAMFMPCLNKCIIGTSWQNCTHIVSFIDRTLTLQAPIKTAADDKFWDIFTNFRKKYGMIFHENRLPADDSHEIPCLICYF